MDFIETLLGISPDGGDGSLEFLWIAAIGAGLAAWLGRHRLRAWLARRQR